MSVAHRGLRSKTLKGWRRLSARWNASSDLDVLVANHQGRLLNKWKHYFEIYDRHFAHLRQTEVSILEIGVESGGSLDLWRSYFGPRAMIVGADINPKCKAFEGPNTAIRIGDQGDPAFLETLASEFGPFDIVIEDGSHAYAHQILAFNTLFPQVRPGGFFCCEDLCTSYWEPEFGGGVRKPGTGIEFYKTLLDEQNAWFWREDADALPADALPRALYGLHFYPTLVVVEKRDVSAPIHVPVGRRAS